MSDTFTIIGDPHATNKSLDKIKTLFQIVEDANKPAIWLGDLLDTKEVIRGNCLNAYFDYFKMSKLEHIIIVGNHDWFNLDCNDHSLKVFESLDNVMIVDSLEEIAENCYAVPYIHDKAELKKILKKIPKDAIVFGHFEVTAFDYGNGRMCDDGLELKDLKRFKRVISGHFHKNQQSGNLVYLGTPFSHTFGESNQRKYLGTYSPSEDKLEVTSTPFPRHITIEMNCDNVTEHGPFPDINKDDYNRVLLIGKQESIDRFPKDKFPEVKFLDRPTDDGIQDILIGDEFSNTAQFEQFSQIQGWDEETKKLGLQILGAIK